jgi:hypothetical protein
MTELIPDPPMRTITGIDVVSVDPISHTVLADITHWHDDAGDSMHGDDCEVCWPKESKP